MIRAALIAFLLPSALMAQGVVVQQGSGGVDVPTATSIAQTAAAAAVAADTTHATTAQLAAKADASAIPPVCAVAPSGDTLNGTVGTGAPCTPPANNTRPTAVQAGNTVLTASCTFTVTFARSFVSATPFVYAAVVDTAGGQMPCKVQTRSSTGFTGSCQGSQTTTLNLTVITAGLNLSPFGSTCTAGTPVMFVGREPSQ